MSPEMSPPHQLPSAHLDPPALPARPGADSGFAEVPVPAKAHLLDRTFWSPGLAIVFLKIGVAFIFLYAALAMSLDPSTFEKWLPDFLLGAGVAPPATIVHLFGLYEIFLVAWLLSGKGLFYSSLFCAVTLSGIILFNLDSFGILFRNVAILFACLALAAMSRKPRTTSS